MLIFQFTLPREERRQVQAQPLTLQNFNPRSHERSDSVWNSALYYIQKFQSTLPREERPFPTDFVTAFMPYFNPRSHERSDTTGGSSTLTRAISIHAPTRGATILLGCNLCFSIISIHAPTRGATFYRGIRGGALDNCLLYTSPSPRDRG